MNINVLLNRSATPIDRAVFEALFEQSVCSDRACVRKALASGSISFKGLVALARVAEIPYPLFFASLDLVEEQLRMKSAKLMVGFNKKTTFSMNSRSKVHLPDVELIVKDLLRKQEYVKMDKALQRNPIIGALRKRGASPVEDAAKFMDLLGLSPAELWVVRNKEAALEVLIGKLEDRHVLVARSAKNYMPQQIPKRAKFSGITVKDSKVPYIFLASGEEGEQMEPAGRRVFTLVLLAVLVARNTFTTVTYSGHTKDEVAPWEHEVTAEILMPAPELRAADLGGLDAVRDVAGVLRLLLARWSCMLAGAAC